MCLHNIKGVFLIRVATLSVRIRVTSPPLMLHSPARARSIIIVKVCERNLIDPVIGRTAECAVYCSYAKVDPVSPSMADRERHLQLIAIMP